MKPTLLFFGIACMQMALHASEADAPIVVSKLPEFETAEEWAQDLKHRYPSFTLVHSKETKRMWFVFFRTVENNLVLCEKRVSKIGAASGTRKIRDANGKSITLSDYDPANDRELPSKGRNFRTEFKIFHEKGWDVYSRDDGMLIALKQPPPKAFRVQYTLRPHDGSEAVVLDEVINFLVE